MFFGYSVSQSLMRLAYSYLGVARLRVYPGFKRFAASWRRVGLETQSWAQTLTA